MLVMQAYHLYASRPNVAAVDCEKSSMKKITIIATESRQH